MEHQYLNTIHISTCKLSNFTGFRSLKSAEGGSAVHIVTVSFCIAQGELDGSAVIQCVSMCLTYTLSTNILFVAHVTLAAVARRCGNAASIQTQVSEMLAHVNGVVYRNRA